MTLLELFNAFVALMESRMQGPHSPESRTHLDALEQTGPSALSANAQPLLNEVPAPPGEPIGSCTYQVGNDTFCLNGMTHAECNGLGGSWLENGSCPASARWAPEGGSGGDS
jgi:hypothetical protein